MKSELYSEEQENNNNLTIDSNNNSNRNEINSKRSGDKYGLRPRTLIKRLQHDKPKEKIHKKTPRPKSRPAPLSKYRRKTANARERHRMKEINNAFESLRKALPDVVETTSQNAMTKITTLRLAVRYIEALSNVLEAGPDSEYYIPLEAFQDTSSYEDLTTSPCSFSSSTSPQLQVTTYVPQLQVTSNCVSQSQITYTCSTTANYKGGIIGNYKGINNSLIPINNKTPGTIGTFGSYKISDVSLGSTGEFDEMLSDDCHLLDDYVGNLLDIPVLPDDSIELFPVSEKESYNITSEFTCYK